jgi:hypothetical protein
MLSYNTLVEDITMIKFFYTPTKHPGYGVLFGIIVGGTLLVSAGLINSKLNQVAETRHVKTQANINQAADAFLAAWENATNYFKSQLDASQPVNIGTTTTGNITIAADPANITGTTQPIATYTATVTGKSGNNYWLSVATTTQGNTTVTEKIYNYVPTPAFNCRFVETRILEGQLDTISDSDLISYAQNGCALQSDKGKPFVDTGSETIDYGTGSPYTTTYTAPAGSGTLNLNNLTTCVATVNNNYDLVKLRDITAGSTLISTANSNRSILAGNIANSYMLLYGGAFQQRILIDNLNTSTINGLASKGIIVKINADDMVLSNIYGFNNNDSVVVANKDINNSGVYLYEGDNQFAFKTAKTSYISGYAGNDSAYFQSLITSSTVHLGNGNNTVFCNNLYGICDGLTTSYIYTGTGNDFIVINNTLKVGSIIHAGLGNNIVYFKGASGVSPTYAYGKSLVILDGDLTNSGIYTTPASGSVLLKKSSGVVSGSVISGFTRTINF